MAGIIMKKGELEIIRVDVYDGNTRKMKLFQESPVKTAIQHETVIILLVKDI